MKTWMLEEGEAVPPDPEIAGPDLVMPDFSVRNTPSRAVTRPSASRRQSFIKRHFPGIKAIQWNDWHWQLANRVTSMEQVSQMLELSEDERTALSDTSGQLAFAVTPYYLSLLDPQNPMQGLRRCVIPVTDERRYWPGESVDPLGEDAHSPVPGIVHRYPDRVLFLVTDFCSTHCRYCTRSRMVGHCGPGLSGHAAWDRAIAYIAATPTVRDVLISGGDPLTLSDSQLESLLTRLRAIPHVEMIRIGTKIPAVLPQRVTTKLVRMLRRFHPLFISLHFTHPDELTPETARACNRLADAGIPLGSQTVLLSGVNDKVETLTSLYHGLLRMRVRPYYLYQCDPIAGSGHFRTAVSKGLEMIRGLRGHTSGYAVPQFVIDAPGGGGKIPLLPDYSSGHDGFDLVLTNYENKTYRYPDHMIGTDMATN
ncbi:MAG: KamA family radical SAM protein [Proteobacteria bacterium]|nr:KamA family radical SAM protein [Pseudomonadota bacterium]